MCIYAYSMYYFKTHTHTITCTFILKSKYTNPLVNLFLKPYSKNTENLFYACMYACMHICVCVASITTLIYNGGHSYKHTHKIPYSSKQSYNVYVIGKTKEKLIPRVNWIR